MADDRASIYRKKRIAHWNRVSREMPEGRAGRYYHRRLRQIYRFLVPAGQRVLELGCGDGNLLASLGPRFGAGVDFSEGMIRHAYASHPTCTFLEADVHALPLRGSFDFVILSDLVNDLWDVEQVLKEVMTVATQRTRVIVNTQSPLWELPLGLAKRAKLARPTLLQNWLTVGDLCGLLHLAGFEVVRRWQEILCPVGVPLFALL